MSKKANVIKTGADRCHATVKTPWIPVPLVTAELKAKGYSGGEGSQWPLYITTSLTDSGLAFMGTDVGGMYRTTDGGENWSMCTVGIYSSAAAGIAIDPRNSSRVICVGVNSTYWNVNGLYLSENAGDSWKQVYTYALTGDETCKLCGHRDFRHQIAFDETSFDADKGYCTVVYWCKETKKYGRGENNEPCLYKSSDGGETWTAVNRSAEIGGGEICVSPAKGYVYIAAKGGVYRSVDGGASFDNVLGFECLGIDTVPSRPNSVFASTKNGFYVSNDNGDSFERVDESGYPTDYPARLRVSPADPNYMILQNDMLTFKGGWDGKNYFTHDGGKSWNVCTIDPSDSFIPYNTRQTVFAWISDDRNRCISTGGDMIMKSTDGGAVFTWGGNGYNGSCATSITCNFNNPRLMAVGNQDYNGAFSTDSGETWKYLDWTGYEWGGYSYGAYCLDENTVVAAKKMGNGKLYIAYTLDGGKTFTDTGIIPATPRTIGVYGNNDIVFVGDYYSHDHCKTWVHMDGCVSVLAVSRAGAVFGRNGTSEIVRSNDYGKNWRKTADAPADISYIDYDVQNDRLLVLCKNQILYTVSTDGGEFDEIADFSDYIDAAGGVTNLRQVAVDPQNAKLMYLTNARGVYATPDSVFRSTDGGETWEIINRNPGDGSVGIDGAREASSIVINNATREVFETGGCRGIYKMKLPD